MPSGATSRKSRTCNERRCRRCSRRSIKGVGRATYLQRYACSYSTKSALTGTCGDILGPDGLRKKPNFKPWRKDYRPLAPRFWRRWTSCLSAHKRHRQIFPGPIETVDAFLFAQGDDSAIGDFRSKSTGPATHSRIGCACGRCGNRRTPQIRTAFSNRALWPVPIPPRSSAAPVQSAQKRSASWVTRLPFSAPINYPPIKLA